MDKLSYALGMVIAENLKGLGANNVDTTDFAKAVADVLAGKSTELTPIEAQTTVQEFMQKQEAERSKFMRKAGEDFLAENAKKEGVVVLPSGLQYTDLKKCITINVLNSPFKLSRKVHSIYRIREEEEQTLLDELLEIHFLDLTKLNTENLTSLEKWLMFIKTDDKEVRQMLAQGNPAMTKANRVMDIFYLDEQDTAPPQQSYQVPNRPKIQAAHY